MLLDEHFDADEILRDHNEEYFDPEEVFQEESSEEDVEELELGNPNRLFDLDITSETDE